MRFQVPQNFMQEKSDKPIRSSAAEVSREVKQGDGGNPHRPPPSEQGPKNVRLLIVTNRARACSRNDQAKTRKPNDRPCSQ